MNKTVKKAGTLNNRAYVKKRTARLKEDVESHRVIEQRRSSTRNEVIFVIAAVVVWAVTIYSMAKGF